MAPTGLSSKPFPPQDSRIGTAAGVVTPSALLAQTLPHINIAGVPEDSITPALYAESAGLFKRYGISTSIVGERSGSAIASGVIGGAFDIGKTSGLGRIDRGSRKKYSLCPRRRGWGFDFHGPNRRFAR